MKNTGLTKKLDPQKLAEIKGKTLKVSGSSLIRTAYLDPSESTPLIIQPGITKVDLCEWCGGNREFIDSQLYKHGALLFRDFEVAEVGKFARFARTLCGELLEYNERSSPRSQVGDNVYTSTDYPADRSIFLHNENSYQKTWPMKLFFFCLTPPQQGGETPIADVRKVFNRVPEDIRRKFLEKKWMYQRNFTDYAGLPWQTVFQTTDRKTVEDHCRRNDIQIEWKGDNSLRTRAVRSVAWSHPHTGEMVWFNHATFFHVSTLEHEDREALITLFEEDDLPTNSYYGDGTRIEDSVLAQLRDAYRRETVSFRWQRGDILMLDNMLVAHGRAPYGGERKILVAMADPISLIDPL
jgi:alpha-ketoglutarate-dependent taurine dioxygenase